MQRVDEYVAELEVALNETQQLNIQAGVMGLKRSMAIASHNSYGGKFHRAQNIAFEAVKREPVADGV